MPVLNSQEEEHVRCSKGLHDARLGAVAKLRNKAAGKYITILAWKVLLDK
jgi:hypothetical protein